MKKIRFYKETTCRWYADIPEWNGTKDDLEMVLGADTMLDIISEGDDEVLLYLSVEYFENSNELSLIRLATEYDNGAFYKLNDYCGINLNLEIWLCDVTKFVFGNFPEKIFLSKVCF